MVLVLGLGSGSGLKVALVLGLGLELGLGLGSGSGAWLGSASGLGLASLLNLLRIAHETVVFFASDNGVSAWLLGLGLVDSVIARVRVRIRAKSWG